MAWDSLFTTHWLQVDCHKVAASCFNKLEEVCKFAHQIPIRKNIFVALHVPKSRRHFLRQSVGLEYDSGKIFFNENERCVMRVSRYRPVVYLQLFLLFLDIFINSFGDLFRAEDVILLVLYM